MQLLSHKAIADWLNMPVLDIPHVDIAVIRQVSLILTEQAEMAREQAEG